MVRRWRLRDVECKGCGAFLRDVSYLTKRCKECQRQHVNEQTRVRHRARRARKAASKQAAKAFGIDHYSVLRDNGHRCKTCRTVLWINVGKAPFHCKQCDNAFKACELAIDILTDVIGYATGNRPPCLVCGNALPVGRKSYCSNRCGREANVTQARDRYLAKHGVSLRPLNEPRKCRLCDSHIGVTNSQGRGRSVCDACNTHRADFKSRARKYGVAYEDVDRLEVFMRDGWRCQLCGKKTLRTVKRNKKTRRLHPRTASIDHIRPLSRGGDHVEANCQCACLSCNVRKNARLVGQPRLF